MKEMSIMPKKKRGNNEGSVYERKDGRWAGAYSVAGKQKYVYGKSQEEAIKKLREKLTSLDKGEFVETSRITVGAWIDAWYQAYGRPRWRESTAAIHADNIRLHIKPALGKIRLQKLRTDQVQSFISKQIEKRFSSASIRKQMEPLKSALKQAVDNRLIPRSPADKVSYPPANQKEIEYLTAEEQKALIPLLTGSTSKRALLFILKTGLRASELCGLRWMDVGVDSFTVRQGVQRVRINGEVKISIAPQKQRQDGEAYRFPPWCLLFWKNRSASSGNSALPLVRYGRAVRRGKAKRMFFQAKWEHPLTGQTLVGFFAKLLMTPG